MRSGYLSWTRRRNATCFRGTTIFYDERRCAASTATGAPGAGAWVQCGKGTVPPLRRRRVQGGAGVGLVGLVGFAGSPLQNCQNMYLSHP